MPTCDAASKATLGFLTVIHHQQDGFFGGYLVLNRSGRPLEFHCTAPIKPNRAEEILYGPTLESFLYGEQIGQTLIGQASAPPSLVCTDQEPVLAAREHVSIPLVLVLPGQPESAGAQPSPEAQDRPSERLLRIDTPHHNGPRLVGFELGRNRLALPEGAADDRRLVIERLEGLTDSFDLAEPFQRIRDAIEEARRAVR
jgi:hypothetical protein